MAKDSKKNSDPNKFKDALEPFFEDYYAHRSKVYKMNFMRGIVFGFGSVIGGTLVITLLLWLLAAFEFIPFVDVITQQVQDAIKNR